jgi:flagellar hook-associated protein 3 FlgL
MRIDSMTYFNSGLLGMSDNQTSIARLNQQIASNQKLLQPKDDPVATEQILDLSNRVAARTQFASNQDRASLALNYETTVLAEMQKALNGARSLLGGISPSNDANLRQATAQRLAGYSSQLLDLANTRDSSGNYIFGGFNTVDKPFDNPLDGSATNTTYVGTPDPGGTRSIEVDVGRLIQVNDNLDGVFKASDPAGNDLLKNLDSAAAKLTNGTATQTDLTNWMDLLQTAINKLGSISYRVSAAYGEVEDVRATSKSLKVQEQNALSDLQSLDQASAIVELQTRQTTLEAAQRAYAKTSGLSLFNYLT